jgi:hypothetical protein
MAIVTGLLMRGMMKRNGGRGEDGERGRLSYHIIQLILRHVVTLLGDRNRLGKEF